MQIEFISAAVLSEASPLARVVDQGASLAGLDPVIAAGASASRFSGKAGQVYEGFVVREGAVARQILVGLGEPAASERHVAIEQAGAALSAKYLTSGEAALTLDLDGAALNPDEAALLLLGARLRCWRHDIYRTRLPEDQQVSLTKILVANAPHGTEAAWASAAALAEGVEWARELVSEPANVIYPVSFVTRARERLAGSGITLKVLGREEMARLGMGALLGVAQGSAREPQLLVMEWNGGQPGVPPLALVGKGVTFDTGGISLKPPGGMEDMKWDMGGAGAVSGALLALARRKARANVVGVCGLVENMPDGAAQRPGDVVTSLSGQTVEVINTDAEGRLVLCDAITWVQREYHPAVVIDLATLTGAMIISLGHEYGGVFANDDDLAGQLIAAGLASGDKLWRLPLGAAYDKLIDSPIADMKNVGPREGGSITAAQFIQRYVDKGTRWAHLDIAGMVWAAKPGRSWDKGATGYGVRVLDRFVRDQAEG